VFANRMQVLFVVVQGMAPAGRTTPFPLVNPKCFARIALVAPRPSFAKAAISVSGSDLSRAPEFSLGLEQFGGILADWTDKMFSINLGGLRPGARPANGRRADPARRSGKQKKHSYREGALLRACSRDFNMMLRPACVLPRSRGRPSSEAVESK
jgi:hypothetical protein